MSILKNLITWGGYNKLKDEEYEFEDLKWQYSIAYTDFYDLYLDCFEAFKNLEKERDDVQRNIFLAKKIFKKFKDIKGTERIKSIDDQISIGINPYITTINSFDASFDKNSNAILSTFSSSLDKSLKRNKGKKVEELTKNQIYAEVGIIAVETIFEGISQVISFNKEVQVKRRKIQQEKRKIIASMNEIFQKNEELYAKTLRIIEVGKVLNMNNQIFTLKYQEINKVITSQSIFKQFWNEVRLKKIPATNEINLKIAQMLTICDGYNKVDKGTIIKNKK